jgi:hypothetical protein
MFLWILQDSASLIVYWHVLKPRWLLPVVMVKGHNRAGLELPRLITTFPLTQDKANAGRSVAGWFILNRYVANYIF